MRSIISFGALLTSSLFFVGHAEASADHRCFTPAVAQAASKPAASPGTTQVTMNSVSVRQPATASMPTQTFKRTSSPKTFADYRRQIKGW